MKNPNGYGSVVKLGGKRRRPFAARVTIGWDDNGKQIYEYLDYYETRPEAMIALAEYNKNPYDLKQARTTFAEIYELYMDETFYKLENGEKVLKNPKSKSNVAGYRASFNTSKELHNMKFVDIRKSHMQKVIDECGKGHGTKRKIKVLYNQLFKHAMENDLVEKDYSDFVSVGENTDASTRKPFNDKEINTLWKNIDRMDFIDTILIMIYTGIRPGELIAIENGNINIEERYMRGGIKTAAGIDRVIPLNKKIVPLIEKRMSEDHEFLIVNHEGKQMKYRNYYDEKWKKIMEQLDMEEHRPHDCRHTFATLMDNAGANKLAVKRIMGHASKDITDKVYTHKDIEQLIKAIDMI